ncbi:MAG: response regulator [Cellvibrionaceae bacterium]|nr:response regulator [Cellvibrionaceae bacterium]
MIVDDSNIIRRKIERCNDHNVFFVVARASNGEEAFRQFQIHRPTVVTMDLTMPKMDGLDCIRKLVELDQNVKILVVSALSDKATGIQALKNGAQGFLCKPFSDEQLVQALLELVN